MGFFKKKKSTSTREATAPREYLIDGRHKIFFNARGLIPVILQDVGTGQVFRLGYMNKQALEMSWQEKNIYLYRRSRGRLQKLGEEQVKEFPILAMYVDRGRRALLILTRTQEKQENMFTQKIFSRE